MKKLFSLIVLGLLWSGNAYSEFIISKKPENKEELSDYLIKNKLYLQKINSKKIEIQVYSFDNSTSGYGNIFKGEYVAVANPFSWKALTKNSFEWTHKSEGASTKPNIEIIDFDSNTMILPQYKDDDWARARFAVKIISESDFNKVKKKHWVLEKDCCKREFSKSTNNEVSDEKFRRYVELRTKIKSECDKSWYTRGLSGNASEIEKLCRNNMYDVRSKTFIGESRAVKRRLKQYGINE